MALSGWEPDQRDNWMANVVPVFEQRPRLRLLTPHGWLVILSFISVVLGAVIGFVT